MQPQSTNLTIHQVVIRTFNRGLTVGGEMGGGAIASPPFGRIEGAAGSGGAPS